MKDLCNMCPVTSRDLSFSRNTVERYDYNGKNPCGVDKVFIDGEIAKDVTNIRSNSITL